MALDTEVGLSPDDFVLDGHPAKAGWSLRALLIQIRSYQIIAHNNAPNRSDNNYPAHNHTNQQTKSLCKVDSTAQHVNQHKSH